jgi:hypothetical protein
MFELSQLPTFGLLVTLALVLPAWLVVQCGKKKAKPAPTTTMSMVSEAVPPAAPPKEEPKVGYCV